jgi:hypothetical protein
MLSRSRLQGFSSDECGAVTPDWVVLTGAIVGLGMVMLNAVGSGADNISDSAASNYASPRVTLSSPSDEGDGMNGDIVTEVTDGVVDGVGDVLTY